MRGKKFNEEDEKELKRLYRKLDKTYRLEKEKIDKGIIINNNDINTYDVSKLETLKEILKIKQKYFTNNQDFLDKEDNKKIDKILKKLNNHQKQGLIEFNNERSKIMYILSMIDFFNRREQKDEISKYSFFEPKTGEIYFANLLLGFKGEMSFVHPVLVLEYDKLFDKIFCVPMTSVKLTYQNGEEIENAPIEGKEFLVNKEFTDMKYNSLILIKEPRTISKFSIINTKPCGNILNKENKNFEQCKNIFKEVRDNILWFTNPKEYLQLNSDDSNKNKK